MAAGELTMPILEAFRSEHPEVRLEVRITELSFGDTSPVLSGEVDAAFMRGPLKAFEAPRLELIPIAEEPRVLLVGASHQLAEANGVDVDEVMDQRTLGLISPTRWRTFWQLDDVRCRANVDQRVPPVRRPSEIQFAIADSSAVLSMPSAMARMTPSPHVAAIPLRGAEMSTIGLVRRKDERNPAVSAFLDVAQTTAANNIDMLPGGRLPG
jgi:DNA-binding transcriptional LysR family regulator